MARTAAIVLAGGLGTRLGGVRKASLKLGGITLLDRAIASMAPADAILVSTGSLPALPLPAGITAIPDLLPESRGPIAGLAAGIAALVLAANPPEIVITTAVDTPFLPTDYIARLTGALENGALAALASYGGQPYPTNAAWRLAPLADLPRRMLAGQAPSSLKSLAASLGAAAIEWPETPHGDPFSNVNTLKDLLNLGLRARSSTAWSK